MYHYLNKFVFFYTKPMHHVYVYLVSCTHVCILYNAYVNMYDRHKSSSVILLLCFTFVVFQQQVVMLPCLPSSLATLYLGLFLSAQKGKQQVNSVFRHILHSFLSSTYGRGCVEHFVWKYIRRTT